jgi:serine phosphatase RsbU (regulator of sigma subunit)
METTTALLASRLYDALTRQAQQKHALAQLQLTYEHDLAALIAQTEQELALETLHLEQTRADVELEIRTQAQANGEKLTETAIAARITAHEVVKSQAQRVLLAKHHVRLAKIADETVSQTLSRQQQEMLDLQRDLAP